MNASLEWAHVQDLTEVLYPGVEVDGATVDPGEVALAWWTGSSGIALCGPSPDALAERLEALAAKLRELPRPPMEAAHISADLDRALWAPTGTGPQLRHAAACVDDPVVGRALCEDTGPAVADPRRATCPHCLDIWNDEHARAPRTPVPIVYRLA